MKFDFPFHRHANLTAILFIILIILNLTGGAPAYGAYGSYRKDDTRNSNPKPTRTFKPEYPEELRNDGITGKAVVKFTINKQGKVIDPEIVSATHEAFGTASMNAIRQWQFIPARKNGEPISKQVQLPFSFTLTLEEQLNSKMGREVFAKVKGKIYKAGKLKNSPAQKNMVFPVYPTELKGSGVEGEATVKFVIDKEGIVINPEIVSTDHEKFGPNALVASLKLEFEPVELDGKLIYVEMEMPFLFAENQDNK